MGNPVCKYILYLTYLGIPGRPKTYPCSIDQGSPLLFAKNFYVCEEPLLYQIPDSFQVAILPYQKSVICAIVFNNTIAFHSKKMVALKFSMSGG